MNHITSKWIVKYKDWHLGITASNEVYDIASKVKLVDYWNNGTICFRLPKSTKRISRNTIRQNCERKEIIIIFDYPF